MQPLVPSSNNNFNFNKVFLSYLRPSAVTGKRASMRLTINGEAREIAAITVLALLEELGLNPQSTVVERNAEIVQRAVYRDTPLDEGDVLELVRIVGGG